MTCEQNEDLQRSPDEDSGVPGYYLPDHAQYRLQKLSEHMRFLARLAEPRTQAEEQALQPAVRMDELSFCLQLLADQIHQVLGESRWPAKLQPRS